MINLYVNKIKKFDAPTQVINEPSTTKSYIKLDTQTYNSFHDVQILNTSYSTDIVVEDSTPVSYTIDQETYTFDRDDKVYSISKTITKTYNEDNS